MRSLFCDWDIYKGFSGVNSLVPNSSQCSFFHSYRFFFFPLPDENHKIIKLEPAAALGLFTHYRIILLKGAK